MEQLERVTVTRMEDSAKTAFWINVYNSLVMHVIIGWMTGCLFWITYLIIILYKRFFFLCQAHLAYGIPHSSLRRLALFHKVVHFFVLCRSTIGH